jgi:thiosulfate/3-mercaptopyruvate sulfurtransferase
MAETAPSPLISAAGLAALLDQGTDIVLLDVGSGGQRLGIGGAYAVELETHFAGKGGGTRGARPLPELDVLEEHVRSWGVRPYTHVIVYDDAGGLQAARAWWTLRWAGLSNVRLLDGGLGAWLAAGHPAAPFGTPPGGGNVTLVGDQLPTLDADAAAAYAGDAVLLDGRAANAFAGDPAAGTGGHIPGSISAPASGNLDAARHFLPADQLRIRYRAFGVDGGGPVGVTCGSGVSAAHDALALELIGIRAALFPGSWTAWSADPARPVEYGEG